MESYSSGPQGHFSEGLEATPPGFVHYDQGLETVPQKMEHNEQSPLQYASTVDPDHIQHKKYEQYAPYPAEENSSNRRKFCGIPLVLFLIAVLTFLIGGAIGGGIAAAVIPKKNATTNNATAAK